MARMVKFGLSLRRHLVETVTRRL